MRTTLLYSIFLLMAAPVSAQQYAIGHIAATFVDDSRNNRNIPVEIYYPSEEGGMGAPVATDAQFPAIAFGHGFVMGWEAYENIWQAVVPNGFVMVFPKTESGIFPSHAEFGRDLAFCISRMQSLNQDSSSLFFGKLSDTSALMGHSMGGGAAILGAEVDGAISALAVLSPAETNPSAIAAAASVGIPALIIAGSNDCVTPPGTNQLPMYQALASVCKTLVTITGASHCQMADFNLLCQIGEATCAPGPEISREDQHQIISGLLVPWLQANLKADCEGGGAFNALLASAASISYERNCEQCEALEVVQQHARPLFGFSPNPVTGIAEIQLNGEGTFEVYDLSGRQLLNIVVTESAKVDLGFLPNGLYAYKITSGQLSSRGKFVKK